MWEEREEREDREEKYWHKTNTPTSPTPPHFPILINRSLLLTTELMLQAGIVYALKYLARG